MPHILQNCPRTHGPRVKRHDALVNYAVRGLEQKGYVVTREPHFKTAQGLRKPDIVAIRGGTAHVIDAQVVTDGEPLRRAHRRKVEKYIDLTPTIMAQFGVGEVLGHSLTVNWLGV